MKQKEREFRKRIQELEREEYPEFKDGKPFYIGEDDYAHHAPSWHFYTRLLTEGIVNDIRENKRKVLSVGAGKAHLERLLANRLRISIEQLVLTDRVPIMPEGFEQLLFDMYEEWPEIKDSFDYVVFPESVIPNRFKTDEEKRTGLYHILENSLRVLKPNGQIRMDAHSQVGGIIGIDTVFERLKDVNPQLEISYNSNLVVVKYNIRK